jgi:hypothetical protein
VLADLTGIHIHTALHRRVRAVNAGQVVPHDRVVEPFDGRTPQIRAVVEQLRQRRPEIGVVRAGF